jgi:hypothetical protein
MNKLKYYAIISGTSQQMLIIITKIENSHEGHETFSKAFLMWWAELLRSWGWRPHLQYLRMWLFGDGVFKEAIHLKWDH